MFLIKARNYCTPWWLYSGDTFPTRSELDEFRKYKTCNWTTWPKHLLELFIPVNQYDKIIGDRARYCDYSYDWKWIQLSDYESANIKRVEHVIEDDYDDIDYHSNGRGRGSSSISEANSAAGIYGGFLSLK